jgi:protein-arginine kinase activator protein McsA
MFLKKAILLESPFHPWYTCLRNLHMPCDHCKKDKELKSYAEVKDGQIYRLSLCEECLALYLSKAPEFSRNAFSRTAAPKKAKVRREDSPTGLKATPEKEATSRPPDIPETCPDCETSWLQAKKGRPGCPGCFGVFDTLLRHDRLMQAGIRRAAVCTMIFDRNCRKKDDGSVQCWSRSSTKKRHGSVTQLRHWKTPCPLSSPVNSHDL